MAIWITLFMAFGVMKLSLSCRENKYPLPQSCKELKERFNNIQDGIYSMRTPSGTVYQTYCDMTTTGGGWTLVASVHENNLNGRCTTGDRWSSQQGGNADLPEGDKSWRNTATFGTTEGATSDDYKNPGYYAITAEDVAVWHVPNDERVNQWKQTAFLRYHTETRFLNNYGGNLYSLFQRFPVKYNIGSCPDDNGPSVPVVYDKGDATFNYNLYGPRTREETEPGYITFRAINNERAATAICSGLKPKACNVEHYCIGGGGHFPELSPKQCGDFTSFDCNGSGLNAHCSAAKQVIEAAVLIFYR